MIQSILVIVEYEILHSFSELIEMKTETEYEF